MQHLRTWYSWNSVTSNVWNSQIISSHRVVKHIFHYSACSRGKILWLLLLLLLLRWIPLLRWMRQWRVLLLVARRMVVVWPCLLHPGGGLGIECIVAAELLRKSHHTVMDWYRRVGGPSSKIWGGRIVTRVWLVLWMHKTSIVVAAVIPRLQLLLLLDMLVGARPIIHAKGSRRSIG